MEIRPRETVILASDFPALMAWYQKAFGFEVLSLFEEDYHYCNLATPTGIQIGIASAKEMGVQAQDRSRNSVLLQFEVDDVKAFFAQLEAAGGTVTFGPSFDEKGRFWYGGIADPEGNPLWIVDKDCP